MKRTTLVGLLVLSAALPGFLHAQNQYYFRTGDTIWGRDTIYHYGWWSEEWLASDTTHELHEKVDAYFGWWNYKKESLRYCYTDTTVNIVGIAGAFWLDCMGENSSYGGYGDGHWMNPTQTMETVLPEYIRLYDYDERGDFVMLKEVEYVNVMPVRYMAVDYRNDWFTLHGAYCDSILINYTRILPIHEFYFDKPVAVSDSFYVGYTENNSRMHEPDVPLQEYLTLTCRVSDCHYADYAIDENGYGYSPGCDTMPYQLYKARIMDSSYLSIFPSTYIDTSWKWFNIPFFMLIFPIIEIDSSYYDGPPQYVCPPIENLHVGHYGEHNAVLLWDSQDEQQSYQVSFGPAGTPPDSGTFFNAPINAYSITGLDSCTHYSAYVRAKCLHDSVVPSVWSDPVDLYLCDSSQVGVDCIMQNATFRINLYPNPSGGQFSFSVKGFDGDVTVTIADATGRIRHKASYPAGPDRLQHTNSLQLPAGVYFVRATDGQHNIVKKLVVK